MKVRQDIKIHATNNRGNPGQLITDTLAQYPVGVRVAAGKADTIKRSVRRIKRGNTPPEPASISDIPELPEEYKSTGGADDLPFLLYDNHEAGQSNENRVLVFGTELGLRHMCDSDKWYIDGTFGTAPRQFKQLFVIRAAVNDVYATCIYGFLPNKLQSTYEEVFAAVLNSCDGYDLIPDPTTISCDFEIAIHNAIKSMLGAHIRIQGCFYHLTQSTWRKIQNEGLSVLYKTDESVKHFCGMLDGLAFLPTDRVQEGMRHLRTIVPEQLEDIVEYFDANYVSGPYKSTRGPRGIIRVVRSNNPKYSLDSWNVYEETMMDGSRTNNVCESWNNGFCHLVGHKNPGLWHTIQCIQKDQMNVLTELERARQGDPTKKRVRRETKQLQQKLKTLCQQMSLGEKSVSEFLQVIGCIVRFIET